MSSTPEVPNNLTRVVLRGAGLAGGGYVLKQVIVLVTYLALARILTPHVFGQFAAGSIVVGVGLLVSESGMLSALVQRRDRVDEAASTAFVAALLGGILLSLGALALAPVIGLYFGSHKIGWVAAAMSGYVALMQLNIVPDALMQRRFSFVRRVVLEPLGATMFGAVAITTTAVGLGVWGLVIGTYAGVMFQVVISWSLVGWRPKRRLVSFGMWRELTRFGRHVIASEGLQVGYSQLQTGLIGRFVGTAALGQFGYALRVATQPAGILVNGLSYVLLPALSRISHDDERFRTAVLRALRWVAVLAFPASLILLALGEPLTVLVFGGEWRPAGRAVAAMCGFSAGWGVVSLASETWKAAGRPQWLPKTHTLGAVIGVALLAAAVPFGLTAVAASISITTTLTACFALWGIARVLDTRVSRLLPSLWPALAASLVMAASIFGLETVVRADHRGTAAGLGLIAAEGLLALVVYLGALSACSPATGRDVFDAAMTLGAGLRRRRRSRSVTPRPMQ